MPIFNCCTKCVCSPGIIHDQTPDCHPVSWSWMHGWLNNIEWSYDLHATRVIDQSVLRVYFDMLFMSVYTTRYWQTPGWLVQESDVCNVYASDRKSYTIYDIVVPLFQIEIYKWMIIGNLIGSFCFTLIGPVNYMIPDSPRYVFNFCIMVLVTRNEYITSYFSNTISCDITHNIYHT